VLPHSGGKIPEDAFRADRLALNRLNKDGISVPDGILLDARRHEKHPFLRHNSDLDMSVIKLVLTPDGRYVPPEGRHHYQNPVTIDSTYVIRPPIGTYKQELRHNLAPPRQPIPVPLELPAKPDSGTNLPLYLDDTGSYFFQSHHGLFSDHFYPFYTPQVWDWPCTNSLMASVGQWAARSSRHSLFSISLSVTCWLEGIGRCINTLVAQSID
jgi:hypothetical protein